MLVCPSAKNDIPNSVWADLTHTYDMPAFRLRTGEIMQRQLSYGFNCWAYNARGSGGQSHIQQRPLKYHWRKLSTITYAEEVPLFSDSRWRGGGPHWTQAYGTTPAPVIPEMGEFSRYPSLTDPIYEMMHFQAPRHSGAYVNVLFMDGHVKPSGMKKLYSLRWHIDYPVYRYRQVPDTFWPEWMQGLPD